MKRWPIAVVLLAATVLFVVSTSGGAASASKAGDTPQDQLFSAYVDAVASYGKFHKPEGKGAAEYAKGLTSYLERKLARFKGMPEYYEALALGIGTRSTSPLSPDPSYFPRAIELEPDSWNVAFYSPYSKYKLQKDKSTWLSDLKTLAARFPDKVLIHVGYAVAALETGDAATAWREVRLANNATDFNCALLFPHRYVLAKYHEGAPPAVPWNARRINLSFPVYGEVEPLAVRAFADKWATLKDSAGAPSPNEMKTFACRFGMIEPTYIIGPAYAGMLISVVDKAAGFEDLSALDGRQGAAVGADGSDAGRGAREYIRFQGVIRGWVLSQFFMERFLSAPYAPAQTAEDQKSGSREMTDEELRPIWEMSNGLYYEWLLCETELKPILEKLATFDYDNPAAFAPKEDAAKDKTAK